MDHQWRQLPPPPHGNSICPMCSISHFPFCPPYPPPPRPPPPHLHPLPPPPPPLPTYHQTTRFPSPPPPPDYPLPDPYHAAPPFPYFADPNDAWQHRVSNVGYRESFPQQPVYNNGYNYQGNGNSSSTSNGYVGTEFDRSNKRPRVNEFGSGGVVVPESAPNQGRLSFSSDNERRLKLIRDHGNTTNIQISNYSKDNNVSNGNDMYSPFQPNNSQQNQPPQQYSSYLPRQEDRVFGGGQPLPPQPPPPPPLPVSPPPPLPMEPPMQHQAEFKAYSSPPKAAYPLFPVPIKPAVTDVSATSVSEQSSGHALVTKQLSLETPTIIDASRLFKHPQWSSRPEHIVIILRGLPGSGKSYLAKMIRDLEVENGRDAPRIHSMDDYFMTEVEKIEESDASKSSSSGRGKKRTVKKVMEYCYEPEMEEVYRDSMLKAFKKTIEDGNFKFVIVDDRNLRVADFAQFWAIAKRSGYEAYISEATYKDPAGCAARNVHGFTLDEIQKMAGQFEEAPLLYLRLDVKSLFHGDELKESGILEVDMDTEDTDFGDNPSGQQESGEYEKKMVPPLEDGAEVASKDEKRSTVEVDHPAGVKELGKSKWSDDLDEDDIDRVQGVKGGSTLTGLMHVHRKRLKSVHWSDQAGNTGFSIGVAKKGNSHSLVIGPGAGYNLKSNPLPDDDYPTSVQGVVKSRRQSTFQEQLRAERESFKAVFDRRRQRIGGLDLEEE